MRLHSCRLGLWGQQLARRISSLRPCTSLGCLLLCLVMPMCARSAPYIPTSDSAVLEHVPAVLATRQLEPLRAGVKAHPEDLQSAVELARGYLRIGRETSDPRFISYAQATLSHWLQQPNPPPAVLVLAATAMQSSHRFDDALLLLDRALASEPNNAQASLTKATVLQVRGRFAEARQACQRLFQLADYTIALTCVASVDSLTGRLNASYAKLLQVAQGTPTLEQDTRSWVLGQLAEMAVRTGNYAAAEKHFSAGLQLAPADAYLQAAYADLLLLMGRNREVIALLKGGEAQDVLLLRLAIAGKRGKAADAARWAQSFDARRRASRADDNPHLREHARFLLEVLDKPSEALLVAAKNWQVQRESADVQLYLRAARRAGSQKDEQLVREWMRATGYEDRTLDAAPVVIAERTP